MSLRSDMVGDAQGIITDEGDPVTLTSPAVVGPPPVAGTIYVLTGIYNRVGMDLDADGQPIVTDKSTLTISLAAIRAAGLVDVEDLKKPGWTVSVLDAMGTAVALRIDTPYLDRTLGVATFILKRSA
jgi:hypothetical protein